jgi:hypothetical protein
MISNISNPHHSTVGVFNYKDIYCEMKQLIRHILREHTREIGEQNEKWSEDRLRDIAAEYNDIADLRKNNIRAYHAMRRLGLYDELTSNMNKPNSYSDEDIEKEARKFDTIKDFRFQSPNFYSYAKRRGLMPKFRKFLESKITNWTDDMLKKEALKYQTTVDFARESGSAYRTAVYRGIYDKITSHFLEKVYSGELLIENLLNKNKIKYVKQHKFLDCNNKGTGSSCKKLPFDFYLKDKNATIEYDGVQHFMSNKFFGGDEGFLRRKQLDKIKNQYCKKNGIKLIRIPYTMKKEEIELYILKELGIE